MAEDGETERDPTCMVLKMRHVTDGAELFLMDNCELIMVNG